MTTIIIQNCNTCKLDGPRKILNKLYQEYRKAHPNRWQIIMNSRGRGWDGYIDYIRDTGTFRIGLLPKIRESLIALGEEVKIEDKRPSLKVEPIISPYLGNTQLYPDQIKALKKLLYNKIGGKPFLIGAGDYSVGFGKSLLLCAIHKAFGFKLRTLVLLKDADLFKQFKRELPPLLPGENITFVQGGKVDDWGNFTVAMVQSVSQNIKKYQRYLAMTDIVLIDEADQIDNKTYKSVITNLWNAPIRIGLSGTIYLSKLKKDEVKNLNIMSFIGPKMDEVRIKTQMNKGRATPVVVKMVEAVTSKTEEGLDYDEEYHKVIVDNPEAYEILSQRIRPHIMADRLPILVVTRFIPHCEKVYKYLTESYPGHNITYIHNNVKNRDKVMQEVREGKVDILVSTLIISRGKNIPQLRAIINMASMKSQELTIQILGRLVRLCQGKSKGYLDDIHFKGKYLSRAGNKRKNIYLKEKLKVIKIKQTPTNRTYIPNTKKHRNKLRKPIKSK